MISLIAPSRGRPQKSFENSKKWIEKAGCDVELIVSLDTSDPMWMDYVMWYQIGPVRMTLGCDGQSRDNIKFIHRQNNSVVEATNKAVKESTGDILIYLSDDFDCFDNWGIAVQKEFEGVTTPQLIKVDDMLQDFKVPVLTIPIMNRALYERLGYFWHPEYKSMFVDEHLYCISKKLNALKFCPHLRFQHNHVSIGRSEDDETYRRSAANWNQGKALFAKHKAQGFPV